MSDIAPGSKSHVDLLKGFAIISVVSIHFIHAYINRFTPGSFGWQWLVAADQITRFSVPAFVALSGYALARKYGKNSPGYMQFFTSRAVKILPAYLGWSAIYYLVGWFVPVLANFSRSTPVWELAVFGRSQYHLYFVPMIFQAYLLFPLLHRLTRKFTLPMLVLSLCLQIYMYQGTGGIGWSDQKQYIQFSSWIYYFILGICLGSVDLVGFLSSRLAAVGAWAVALFGLVWTVADGFSLLHQGKNLLYATAFTRPPVLLFATGTILALFFVTRPKFVVRLGAWSYHIYLGHVLFLQLFSEII